jgi:hypothetical protein
LDSKDMASGSGKGIPSGTRWSVALNSAAQDARPFPFHKGPRWSRTTAEPAVARSEPLFEKATPLAPLSCSDAGSFIEEEGHEEEEEEKRRSITSTEPDLHPTAAVLPSHEIATERTLESHVKGPAAGRPPSPTRASKSAAALSTPPAKTRFLQKANTMSEITW